MPGQPAFDSDFFFFDQAQGIFIFFLSLVVGFGFLFRGITELGVGSFLQAKKIKKRPELPIHPQPPTETDSELVKERWREYLKRKKERDERLRRLALIGITVVLLATASPHFIPLLESIWRSISGGGS